MKKVLGQMKMFANSEAKVRKGVMTVVAVFFALQVYFVRELVVAELFFGLGFAVLLLIGGLAYVVVSVGERGLEFAEAGVRAIGDSARRWFQQPRRNQ
jgi:phage shock protein PspC (stress-responsive transcriptional regulator)